MNPANCSTITIQAAIRKAEQLLGPIHESARIDAEVLLAHGINQSRTYLHTWPEHQLTPEQSEYYSVLIQRRAAGEPVAYLTGIREFWSLPLTVTNATLVPRPETELLVEHALRHIATDSVYRIADLGTGCGAIALAIACERPTTHIVATDIDISALEIAQTNAKNLGIGNIEFRQGNWLEPLKDEYFNIIVSNPPYIREGDPCIQRKYLCFEPKDALISGKEGLEAIKIIISQSKSRLLNHGWLLVEHGHDQQDSVLELFTREGFLHIAGITDISGHGRIVIGQYLTAQT